MLGGVSGLVQVHYNKGDFPMVNQIALDTTSAPQQSARLSHG